MAVVMAVKQGSTPRCANCGAEIPWRPRIYRGKTYCCGGCAQGSPCYCSYDLATFAETARTPSRHPHPAAWRDEGPIVGSEGSR